MPKGKRGGYSKPKASLDADASIASALRGATYIPKAVKELPIEEAQRLSAGEKQAAVRVLQDVAASLPEPEQSQLTRRVMDKAYSNFEDAVGGRQKLVDALTFAPETTKGLKAIRKLLNDPDFGSPGRYPLFTLCQRNRVSLPDIVQAFRDATIARLNVEALTRLGHVAPKVITQVGEDAQNRMDSCLVCGGSGRLDRLNEDGEPLVIDGKTLTRPCHQCAGQGEVFRRHDSRSREHFLKITGIIQDSKGKQDININTQLGLVNANFTPGEGTFERLIKAVDEVRAKALLPTMASTDAIIDVNPIISLDPAEQENAGDESTNG